MKRQDHLHRPMPNATRTIAIDSPEAAARVLILSILADGQLGTCEVDILDQRDAYSRIGLSRDAFYRAMRDICGELLDLQTQTGESMFNLDGEFALGWIDAVQDATLRQTVAALIFDVIRSDGIWHPAESRLIWRLFDRWGWTLDELRSSHWTVPGEAGSGLPTLPTKPRSAPVHHLQGATVVA